MRPLLLCALLVCLPILLAGIRTHRHRKRNVLYSKLNVANDSMADTARSSLGLLLLAPATLGAHEGSPLTDHNLTDEDWVNKCRVDFDSSRLMHVPTKPVEELCLKTNHVKECKMVVMESLQDQRGDLTPWCRHVYSWFAKHYGMPCPEHCGIGGRTPCQSPCHWVAVKAAHIEGSKASKASVEIKRVGADRTDSLQAEFQELSTTLGFQGRPNGLTQSENERLSNEITAAMAELTMLLDALKEQTAKRNTTEKNIVAAEALTVSKEDARHKLSDDMDNMKSAFENVKRENAILDAKLAERLRELEGKKLEGEKDSEQVRVTQKVVDDIKAKSAELQKKVAGQQEKVKRKSVQLERQTTEDRAKKQDDEEDNLETANARGDMIKQTAGKLKAHTAKLNKLKHRSTKLSESATLATQKIERLEESIKENDEAMAALQAGVINPLKSQCASKESELKKMESEMDEQANKIVHATEEQEEAAGILVTFRRSLPLLKEAEAEAQGQAEKLVEQLKGMTQEILNAEQEFAGKRTGSSAAGDDEATKSLNARKAEVEQEGGANHGMANGFLQRLTRAV